MKILRNGIEIYDLAIDNQTTITRRLMVENTLNLNISVAAPLDLRIGDYVTEADERYELAENPQYSLSSGVYNYTALFVGNLHRLERWQIPDKGSDDFFFFGTMSEQISYIVNLLNVITTPTGDGGWTYEIINPETIDSTPRNVNYASLSILGAMQKIAQEFTVEFDLVSKQFAFAVQIKRPTALSFAVGQGRGLYKISRERLTDAKIATRLYGYGGKTNVEFEHRLQFDGGSFVEKNIDKYGLREDRVVFDHIYPRRNGSITSNAIQKSEGSAYWRVADTTLEFNLTDQLIDGAKIIFNSGECAGLEFVISSYDHSTKTITFKEYADDSSGVTYTAPNINRCPRTGDQYVFTGIAMPESYLTAAKAELKAATQAEMDRLSVPQHPYSVDCDPRYFRSLNFTPSVGDLCHLVDTDSNLDASVRIVAIEYSPVEPWALKLTLSDKIPVAVSSLIKREVKQTVHALEVVDRRQEFNARKNAKALNELANFLLDADGNFDEELITARLVRARQYEGGNPSQDLSIHNITVTPAVTAASVSGGSLTHHTYEVSGVGSTWAIGARTFADLDPNKAYYLYAKCSKMTLEGTFEISPDEELSVDHFSDDGVWVFNLGVLFKVREGEDFRDFVFTYGMFRQIGGQIIGSSLSSIDGFNVWNLDGGRFRVGTLDSYFDFNLSERNQLTLYNAKLISCTGNQKGDKGDYMRYAYKWTDSQTPPAPPVGSDPDGWTWNNLRGQVITDHQGRIMTDQGGRMIFAPYPQSYRLWTSIAYFSGADNTLIGMWSTPFVQSGSDGADGKDGANGANGADGKDVDPAVLLDLQTTAKAIKENFTSIDGGLVLTSLIKLLNNGIEQGGVSGIPTLKDPNTGETRIAPAAWFGGSYAEAINSLANIVMWHNGDAKLGDLYLDAAGAMKIKDQDGKVKVIISKSNISSIESINNQYIYDIANNSQTVASRTATELPNKLLVAYDNSQLTISASIAALVNPVVPDSWGEVWCEAWLTKDGAKYIHLGKVSASAWFVDNPMGDKQSLNIDRVLNVSRGTYGIMIQGESSGSGHRTQSASISSSTLVYEYFADISRIEIGRDGMLCSWGAGKFLHMSTAGGRDDTFITLKGKTDMPGMLAKARVTSQGQIDRKWGKNILRVENVTGQAFNKRIWHEPIIKEYSTFCTGYGGADNPKVYNETTDYVELYANGGFNVMLTGDNS